MGRSTTVAPLAIFHRLAERIGWMRTAHELPAFERFPPQG
jgi:hypothetical protein